MINKTDTALKNAIKILTDDYMINNFYMDTYKKIKHLETIADLTVLYFEYEEVTK